MLSQTPQAIAYLAEAENAMLLRSNRPLVTSEPLICVWPDQWRDLARQTAELATTSWTDGILPR